MVGEYVALCHGRIAGHAETNVACGVTVIETSITAAHPVAAASKWRAMKHDKNVKAKSS